MWQSIDLDDRTKTLELEVVGRLEDSEDAEIQEGIRWAILALQLAQEILAGLTVPEHSSIQPLLRERARVLGGGLSRAELEVVSKFLGGQSPEAIAEERGLSARTVSNQIRSGCRRLGFRDRRELKGWVSGASGYILTRPPED